MLYIQADIPVIIELTAFCVHLLRGTVQIYRQLGLFFSTVTSYRCRSS